MQQKVCMLVKITGSLAGQYEKRAHIRLASPELTPW